MEVNVVVARSDRRFIGFAKKASELIATLNLRSNPFNDVVRVKPDDDARLNNTTKREFA